MARYTLVVCGNQETLTDGWASLAGSEQEVAAAGQRAALEVLVAARVAGHDLDWEVDSIFQHWHGGKHARCGERVGGGGAWGYSAGQVCCHARQVPKWLKKIIDRAQRAMDAAREAADAAYIRQDAEFFEGEVRRLAAEHDGQVVERAADQPGRCEVVVVAPANHVWASLGDNVIGASWTEHDVAERAMALRRLERLLAADALEFAE